jgi:hypothetical protein
MTLEATRKTKLGDVLKAEEMAEHGFVREERLVTVTTGMEIGAVLEETSVAGKATLVVVATTADTSAVLIDPEVDNKTAGDHTLVCLVRGDAIVAKDSLTYGADIDTDPEKDAVIAVLEALGIVVRDQV